MQSSSALPVNSASRASSLYAMQRGFHQPKEYIRYPCFYPVTADTSRLLCRCSCILLKSRCQGFPQTPPSSFRFEYMPERLRRPSELFEYLLPFSYLHKPGSSGVLSFVSFIPERKPVSRLRSDRPSKNPHSKRPTSDRS